MPTPVALPLGLYGTPASVPGFRETFTNTEHNFMFLLE